jgi:trimeric autotransporter adhesin
MSTLKVTNITPQSGNNIYLTGSLIISETLIAKEIRTELTQSVTLFQSGSTQFGDTADDTHTFTGDVTVTGAVGITGYADISASLSTNDTDISALQTDSASFSTRLTTEETNVDALQLDSASFSTRLTTEETNVDALQTDSASFSTRITTAESELGNTLLSSSAQIADDISGSFVAASSSIATDIDALQTDSGSFSTRVADLESFSSSLDATYATDAQLATATGSLSSSLATDIAANTADIVTLTGETGSYALTANVVANENTASFASTGSNTYTGNQIVSASVLLTLQQLTGSIPTGVATGSLIVSGSPVQLYIYNGSGSGWNRV